MTEIPQEAIRVAAAILFDGEYPERFEAAVERHDEFLADAECALIAAEPLLRREWESEFASNEVAYWRDRVTGLERERDRYGSALREIRDASCRGVCESPRLRQVAVQALNGDARD